MPHDAVGHMRLSTLHPREELLGSEDRLREFDRLFGLPGLRADLGGDQRLTFRLGYGYDGHESVLVARNSRISVDLPVPACR